MLKLRKSQNVQKLLVKNLLKDIAQTKKEIIHNNVLSTYDKENTIHFLLNVEKQEFTSRPVASKSPAVDDVSILCYKIMFYSKQYSIYQKHYNEFKQLNCDAFNNYKVFLYKLVSHLRVKKQSLINDLYNQKQAK